MIYLCNGLSSSMLHDPNMKEIRKSLTESEFVEKIRTVPFKSIIGHKDLANVLTMITGREIPYNRQAIRVGYDDYILLVSLDGRLPEHPTYVEYTGKLRYYFVRFERPTREDNLKTIEILENLSFENEEIKECI